MDDKLSDEALDRRLKEAGERVHVGGRYRHYKGHDYSVTGFAIFEDTQEVGVVYRAEYGARFSFIRPLGVWLETVEVDGGLVPRFKLLSD